MRLSQWSTFAASWPNSLAKWPTAPDKLPFGQTFKIRMSLRSKSDSKTMYFSLHFSVKIYTNKRNRTCRFFTWCHESDALSGGGNENIQHS